MAVATLIKSFIQTTNFKYESANLGMRDFSNA